MNDRDKIIEKLAKLRAHAESADKIGSTQEAEAFAAMLQKLLNKHKLEMTDIEFQQEEQDEPVEQHPVNWQDVKVRSTRVAWIEQLAIIITRAHFCRMLVHSGSSRITIIGRKSDAAVAEYMLVTLVRAAEKIARFERRAYRRECKRRCTYCGESREAHVMLMLQGDSHPYARGDAGEGFKVAFLASFTSRLRERYEAERKAQENVSELALVRFNRADGAVKDFMTNMKTRRASIVRGSRFTGNAEGRRRGRAAADNIGLRANAVGAGGQAKQIR